MRIILDKIEEYKKNRKREKSYLKKSDGPFFEINNRLMAEPDIKKRHEILDGFSTKFMKEPDPEHRYEHKQEIIFRIKHYFCEPYEIFVKYADSEIDTIVYEGDEDMTLENVIEAVKDKKNVRNIEVMATDSIAWNRSNVLEIDFELV